MASRLRAAIILFVCVLPSTGCMACLARSAYGVGIPSMGGGTFVPVYSGVAQMVAEMKRDVGPLGGFLLCLDLPLTLVVDTLLLPVDLAQWPGKAQRRDEGMDAAKGHEDKKPDATQRIGESIDMGKD